MNDRVFALFNEGVRHSLEAHELRSRGDVESASERDRKAIAAFDKALELDPGHHGAMDGKALSKAALGETEEAIVLFEAATRAAPDFPEYYRQLGLCYIEMGDAKAARKATLKAVELDGSADYRRGASVEIYNFGGEIMKRAALHRDSGQRDEEVSHYLLARRVFSLAREVDAGNMHVGRALEIVESCLQRRGEGGSPTNVCT